MKSYGQTLPGGPLNGNPPLLPTRAVPYRQPAEVKPTPLPARRDGSRDYIRRWARSHGFHVYAVGALPKKVLDAYDDELKKGTRPMSLTEYPDLEQGTPEWYDARRGIITASVIGQLITPSTIKPANNPASRSLVAELAAERITGWTDEHYVSDDMARGHEVEPHAALAYEKHFGVTVKPSGFMVRDDWGYRIGYSPDGVVGGDGLIECKSRRPKKHLQTILADAVPPENMGQCQAALLVSGRHWIDYVSYSGGMALWVKRVEPDPKWQAAILETVAAFEKAAGVMQATYEARTLGLPMTERIFEQEMVI